MAKNYFFIHLKTVMHHRRLVRKGCFSVGLYLQGLTHDLSKFSPEEFSVGMRFYQGVRSPNTEERKVLGFSKAWMHHKGRNKHHFEYWTDIRPETGKYGPVEMPPRYLAEMAMDRIAACKVYQGADYTPGSALAYLEKSREHAFMHPVTEAKLRCIFSVLEKNGEEAMYDFVKNTVLKGLPFGEEFLAKSESGRSNEE